jgi:hypothetical protein
MPDTPASRPSAPPSDPRETPELRARLAALNEVHEFYEFDATTEEQFDTWLHERIKEVRGQLGIGAPAPRSGDGDPPTPRKRKPSWLDKVGPEQFLLECADAVDDGKNPLVEADEYRALSAALASQRAARARAEEERDALRRAAHRILSAANGEEEVAAFAEMQAALRASGQPEAVSRDA